MIVSKDGRKFKIERKLNKGGFGSVFQALEISTSTEPSLEIIGLVAVKFVSVFSETDLVLLSNEISVFGKLSKLPRFPRFIEHVDLGGTEIHPRQHALVHQLLGPSLHEIALSCKKSPVWTKLFAQGKVIKKTLRCLMDIHAHRILHCDIKLQNFCSGLFKEKESKVYLIDFGLAIDLDSSQAQDELQKRSLRGTPCFMSLHVQVGGVYTYMDDLVSLFYSIVFAVKGLPWDKETSPDQIICLKQRFSMKDLVRDISDRRIQSFACFIDTHLANRVLYQQQPPDYELLLKLVHSKHKFN